VTSFDSAVTPADFVQPGEFLRGALGTYEQGRLVGNVAAGLSKADQPIREVAYGKCSPDLILVVLIPTDATAENFTKIDKDLSARVKADTRKMAAGPGANFVTQHYLL
jgi:hypothetical protein